MDKSEVLILVLILGVIAAIVSTAVYYVFGRSLVGIIVLSAIIIVLFILRRIFRRYLIRKLDTSRKDDK